MATETKCYIDYRLTFGLIALALVGILYFCTLTLTNSISQNTDRIIASVGRVSVNVIVKDLPSVEPAMPEEDHE